MRWFNPLIWAKWINLQLARKFGKPGCGQCARYNFEKGVCSVYFLHQKQIFYLKASPWEECLLEELKGDIKIADRDLLEAEAKKIKTELEKEDDGKDRGPAEGKEDLPGRGD